MANAFEIKNIEISEPFESNFNKNDIINSGFKKAFSELLSILIKSSDLEKVKETKLNEIKGMIQSFSIQEERFIDQVYYVNLGVSFDKKKIFRYLEKKNIFPTQPIRETFLFIPIIINENTDDLILYSNNKIYINWNKSIKKSELVNYILPTEDIEDLNLIKKNFSVIENYEFKEIIDKYFLKNSVVALIFTNNNEIRVLSRIIIKDKIFIKNSSFKSLDLNDENQSLILIEELRQIYEDKWKEFNHINTSIKLPLMVRVDNTNSKKITDFETILKNTDLVNNYFIHKFNKDHIYYEIIFNGTPNIFIQAMDEKSLKFDTQNKVWILK